MTIIGNHKPSSIILSTMKLGSLVMVLCSTPLFAESDWDKEFFKAKCPGISSAEVFQQDFGDEVDIKAEDTTISKAGNVSFKGNVRLKSKQTVLLADSAELNKFNNSFNAKGNVRYNDQYLRLKTQGINFDYNNELIAAESVKFQLIQGSLRGEAETLKITPDGLNISDVGITSCPPGEEGWLLKSSKISIDAESGFGEAEDVVLRINDVSVFYFPTISFPVDERRKSGFLYPSVGNSLRTGFELDIPWYWNIDTDKDATFTGRYLSKRGLMLGTEYRQMTEDTFSSIYFEYMANDDKATEGNEERYLYQVNSSYSEGEHWRGNLDLNSVSDDDYFYDFGGNYSSGNRNYLKRYAEISFNDQHMSFTGLFSKDQLLSSIEEPYSRLPQLRLSLLYPDVFSRLTTNLHLQATAFRHQNLVEAERLMIIPEISLPMNWISGYIKPILKFHHSRYNQDDPLDMVPEKVTRTVPIFTVDSAMIFERAIDFSGDSFIQTLEPRLFYLYVPEREQSDIALFDTTSVDNGVDSLFRDNRYSGYDRIGDSNQVSVALTSRFYEDKTGRERLSLTVGRAYYLEDRKVNLAVTQIGTPAVDLGVDSSSNSALVTNLQLSLYNSWSLKGEFEYDDVENKTNKGVLGVQYLTNSLALNLRHRLNRYNSIDNIEQAEVSFSWQASKDWSIVARWQGDIRNNRTIDSFAGLEYESCCWAIRLVARRYLNIRLDQQGQSVPGVDEFNTGIYLEFILKGLTNIGNGLNLENDVQGYEDRF